MSYAGATIHCDSLALMMASDMFSFWIEVGVVEKRKIKSDMVYRVMRLPIGY